MGGLQEVPSKLCRSHGRRNHNEEEEVCESWSRTAKSAVGVLVSKSVSVSQRECAGKVSSNRAA